MANIWLPDVGLWIDPNSGNTYDPQEGFWRDADRRQVFGGIFGDFWQPAPGGYISPASSSISGWDALGTLATMQGVDQGTGPGAFQGIPGYGFKLEEMRGAQEKLIQDISGQNRLDVQSQADAAAMARQQGQLSSQESQFAKSHALQRAQLELQQAGEARLEREMAARLAANPADWIAYQYYARQPGNVAGQNNLPGASSEIDIQNIAQGLFNPGNTAYSPSLQGTGAFGAQIQAPNTMSRSDMSNLSSSQQQMLSGLLKAGIDTGGGKRVSVDPGDYFGQVERSLIPTLSSLKSSTQYR